MSIEKGSAATTYISSGAAVIGGLSANEIAAYGGLLIAILAFVTNISITIYFKRQHLKLAREAVESGDAKIMIDGEDK